MNTTPRNFSPEPGRPNLPLLIILGLVVLGTLLLAAPLSSLPASPGSPGYSAPALFNQANADAQQGRTGLAIANYERARLLAPRDPDIAANLGWVRNHAGLPTAPANWLDLAVSWASPNTMALLGWLGLILTGTGILSAQPFPRGRSVCRLAVFIGIVLLSLSTLSGVATWQKCHQAVIVASEISARVSPVSNGETSFKLQAGEMVAVNGHYHDFTLVQNSAGHSGWVAQTDLTPLIPQ